MLNRVTVQLLLCCYFYFHEIFVSVTDLGRAEWEQTWIQVNWMTQI